MFTAPPGKARKLPKPERPVALVMGQPASCRRRMAMRYCPIKARRLVAGQLARRHARECGARRAADRRSRFH